MTDKKKSIPLRMCIVCRNMIPKKELIRIVRGMEGNYFIDTTFRANGRGAYICDKPECMEKCLKKKLLNHAFSAQIPEDVYRELMESYANKQNS